MMLKSRFVRSILLVALLVGMSAISPACVTGKPNPSVSAKPGNGSGLKSKDPVKISSVRPSALSREAASIRSKQVAHVAYRLWFGLDATHSDYEGRAVVIFELKPKAKESSRKIAIDFEGGRIQSLSLNEQRLHEPSYSYDGHRISFSPSELVVGMNRIEISFSHAYGSDGNGLHRFKDPADGRVYLYSNSEPYNAHRMFPCFDQPDLKASYEVTVEAPEDWLVVSNTQERAVSTIDGRKSWAFPPSPVFSTYVFALHAGPYAVWKSEANGIPLRLLARQSMAQHVDHKEWLEITASGLDFFSVEFGYPYPYSKYDQIIVPDFNAGAMENVAAVTFSERMIYRTKVTQDRHRSRANTILHEMAHMWFGDLVTMKWWNGLWLNESFASYLASKAVDKATEFKGEWQDFFTHMKEWAYWEDQLVTTHPIEVPVVDTDQANANFDGITYGKGAAALKQLNYYLGEEDFREGIQRYFQKYAMRNTSIHDFIHMLSEASSRNLSKWQKSWFQTQGVNTLRAAWECSASPDAPDDPRIRKFNLVQSGPKNHPELLRAHRTEIVLYGLQRKASRAGRNGELTPLHTLSVTYSAAETPVFNLIGRPCPLLVYPNYKDHDYVKVELDPISLETSKRNLAKILDPFVRQMLWHTLWEMVYDGKLRPQDYADVVLTQSDGEKDTQILTKILGSLAAPSANQDSVLRYLYGKARTEYRSKIESFIRSRLMRAPGGSDIQLVWYRALLDSSFDEESLSLIRSLLVGKRKLPGFKVDQDRRWEIVQALARAGTWDAKDLIQKELMNDPTDTGIKSSIAAEAAIPDIEIKKRWIKRILAAANPGTSQTNALIPNVPSPVPSPAPAATTTAVGGLSENPLPIAKLREAMRNFQILAHEDLIRESVDVYFDALSTLPSNPSPEADEFFGRFASLMFPGLCEQPIVDRTTALLEARPDLPAPIVKKLKIHRQEEERCILARKGSG